ncbi:protease complex subunit PrcB family protein [Flavobacterium sp.]|uniref:protease complex subunit PrcB family protein n=1 Tax=Flavobacterium sp. TaxID=239 RepID=UPI003D6A5436
MKKTVCYLLFLSLMACGSNSLKNAEAKNSSGNFEVIYRSIYSGLPQKTYRVIRNNEDFRAFFISMKEDKVPEVNFETSNVLILNMGRKNTGGYDVFPEKMIDDGNKVIMIIKEVFPQKGDMVTTALTSPICIVKINSKKEIIIK